MLLMLCFETKQAEIYIYEAAWKSDITSLTLMSSGFAIFYVKCVRFRISVSRYAAAETQKRMLLLLK